MLTLAAEEWMIIDTRLKKADSLNIKITKDTKWNDILSTLHPLNEL